MTPIGQEAADWRDWAWESPAARVALAISKVDELARRPELSTQEIKEIQDAGTMLSRLASSLSPAGRTLPPGTISSQVAG